MKILITGAAGLVGSHLARRLAREHDVLALMHGDLDITDRAAVRRCLLHEKPALIFNCAVLQVDDSEQQPAKAEAVNVDGPRCLAEAASDVGAEIVHFSTQYAFAGEPVGRLPYTVQDEPNRSTTTVGQRLPAKRRCARRARAVSSCARRGSTAAARRVFSARFTTIFEPAEKVRAIDDIWSSTTLSTTLIERVMTIRRPAGTVPITSSTTASARTTNLPSKRAMCSDSRAGKSICS